MMSFDVASFVFQAASSPIVASVAVAAIMANTTAQMDDANRAMCFALRNPPAGTKKSSLKAIAGHVFKKDGTHPSLEAVRVAAKEFGAEREKRGRKKGDKKTTAADCREIM